MILKRTTGVLILLSLIVFSAGCSEKLTDPSIDEWTIGAPLPTPRAFASAGVIDGKFYVAGGDNQDWPPSTLNVLEVYDPVSDSWESKRSMDIARKGGIAGVIGRRLLIVGGFDEESSKTLNEYDPDNDIWSEGSLMTIPRYYPSAGVIEDKLYVAGGKWNYTTGKVTGFLEFKTFEVYDPATRTWTYKTPMPKARHGAASGVINGRLYLVGGWPMDRMGELWIYTP